LVLRQRLQARKDTKKPEWGLGLSGLK